MADDRLIALLDAELPQTQCGLCGHAEGCLPYATAMVQQQEPANRCVPGGQPVADQLARLLGRPALPVEPSDWPLGQDQRPLTALAVIRESECIGCTKCLIACPVDAIVGSAKRLHTVISADCTGCELCLPPCPVDCIDLVLQPVNPSPAERSVRQQHWRQRHQQHLSRLAHQSGTAQPMLAALPVAVAPRPAAVSASVTRPEQTLALAPLRSQIGRLQRQLQRQPQDARLQAQLQALQQQLDALQQEPAP